MLRVREVPGRVDTRVERGTGPDIATPRRASGRRLRLSALGALGIALGSVTTIFTVSLVQADDDAGIRAFHLEEARRRSASQPAAATAYAPAGQGSRPAFFQTGSDGRIGQPVGLNPFKTHRDTGAGGKLAQRRDVGAGSASRTRTICVRLCDGFHAPLGFIGARSDMDAHQSLCEAMNPGIPVKVFRVAAGATGIDDARAADGQRYADLPVAYAHEKAGATVCRPAIVQADERRVSLLRDFTLRPGDSVVLDGKVKTFAGGSRWPYSSRDFHDFRSAAELSNDQRRQIDERVGISRMEAQHRGLQRQMRLREASLQDETVASDALVLRGSLDPATRGPARLIPLGAVAERL